MADIKSDFESIWVSFVEAIVRFWNNRFQKNNEEVLYLRDQIESLRLDNRRLIENLLNRPTEINLDEEEKEFKPVTSGRHIPWHERRRKLEYDSRQEAMKLREEAIAAESMESERSKSTEQLESELGIR